MRLEDDLKLTVGYKWKSVVLDRTQWKMLEEAYVKRHTELRDTLQQKIKTLLYKFSKKSKYNFKKAILFHSTLQEFMN